MAMSVVHELINIEPSANTRMLRVRIDAGLNLAKKDIFGASDPYVRISLFRGSRNSELISYAQTRTIRKNLNPMWQEEFLFKVNPRDNTLLFEVFDENRITRDDFLGLVEIGLGATIIHTENSGTEIRSKLYLLRPRTVKSRVRGDLKMYIAYLPQDNPSSDEVPDVENINTNGDDQWEIVRQDTNDIDQVAGATALLPPPGEPTNTDINQNSEELADGWEARIDERGRKFYVNHHTRTTHWTIPNSATEPLPPGWEEKTDGNGRVYYLDHNTKTSTWHRPNTSTIIETDAERRQAADNFRQRRHVSQDDTLSMSSAIAGPVQALNLMGNHSENLSRSLSTSISPNEDDDDEPLPPGWAKSKAPDGRIFYIDHNTRKTSWEDPRSVLRRKRAGTITGSSQSTSDITEQLGPLPEGWEQRLHTNGRSFFIDHSNKRTTWEDPRLKSLSGPALQYSTTYKQKYDAFRSKLRKPANVPNKYDIKVHRKTILEDTFRVIMSVKRADLLKTRLWIEFDDEVGLDYGGVAREFFYLLSKEMFNPYYGLFEYSAIDDYTLQINSNSGIANPEHLLYFKFIGRICGMAVFHGKLIDGYFIRPFYKMMLGHEITLDDMESVDSEYHRSLKYILEEDPACLELTFSATDEVFGKAIEFEFCPGGKDIAVTNENKQEYIKSVIDWRFSNRVKDQMMNFIAGFTEFVPLKLLQIFDAKELELLLAGMQDIDVNDWKEHTQYRRDYNKNHPVIVFFWKAVYSFNNETRSKLLQFVTGTSRVPMNGFRELYGSNGPQLFTIELWGVEANLPRAHTCFNRLDLPPYKTYSDLREKLLLAIENTQGFDGVD